MVGRQRPIYFTIRMHSIIMIRLYDSEVEVQVHGLSMFKVARKISIVIFFIFVVVYFNFQIIIHQVFGCFALINEYINKKNEFADN